MRHSHNKLALYQFLNADKRSPSPITFSPAHKQTEILAYQGNQNNHNAKDKTKKKNDLGRSQSSPNVVNRSLLKTMQGAFKLKSKVTDQIGNGVGPAKSSPPKHLNSTLLKGSTVESQKKTALDESQSQQLSALVTSYGFLDTLQSPQKGKEQPKDKKMQVKQQKSTARGRTASTTPSQDQEQYEEDATPGPGAYEVGLKPKASFRSKKTSIRSIFYSKLQRFNSPQKEQTVPIPELDHQHSQSPSKENSKFFISRMPKFYESPKQKTPPPGYYNTRQTLEHDLVRNILKSSNSVTFVSNISRSPFKIRNQYIPGPGAYHSSNMITGDQLSQESFFFKSSIERDPYQYGAVKKTQNTVLPALGEKGQEIHVKKDDKILQKEQWFQVPPFMSSQDRFPTPKPKYIEPPYQPAKRPAPIKENIAPFNSSSNRSMQFKTGQGVGVGLYSNLNNWQKKSHNINQN